MTATIRSITPATVVQPPEEDLRNALTIAQAWGEQTGREELLDIARLIRAALEKLADPPRGAPAELPAVRYFLTVIGRNVDEIARREGAQNLYRLGALGELSGLAAGISGYWPAVAAEAEAIKQRAKLAMDRA